MYTRVKVDEIQLDKSIYPRELQGKNGGADNFGSWVTVYQYQKTMESGTKFPPITVAKIKEGYTLIDGWHRLQAYKNRKKQVVLAEVIKIPKKQFFMEAVRRNAGHGRPFSQTERRNIITRLKKENVSLVRISAVIGIPVHNIERFVSSRTVYANHVGPTLVKKSFKHMAGQEVRDDVAEIQDKLMGLTQEELFISLINILKVGGLNLRSPNMGKLVDELYGLLGKVLTEV